MAKDTSLLNKKKVPTVEEMKSFFKSHDFTTEVSTFDPDKADESALRFYGTAQQHFRKTWNEQMKSFGGSGSMLNMSHNDPLRVLEDADEQLIIGTAAQIASDEELYESLMDSFFESFKVTIFKMARAYAKSCGKRVDDLSEEEVGIIVDTFADELLSQMMGYLQQVQSVPEILDALQGNRAFEDFNESILENHDKIDFERQWYHLRTKVGEMLSLEELCEQTGGIDAYITPEGDEIDFRDVFAAFYQIIDDSERTIIKEFAAGKTYQEIAEVLGYKTHSAISKKIAKMKDKYHAVLQDYYN